jgi:hypothetical protein
MTNKLIIRAVQALAPDLDFRVENDDIDTIESLNGKDIPSKAAITAQIKIVEKELADEITNREAARSSALAKLAALGLTTEEISAIS